MRLSKKDTRVGTCGAFPCSANQVIFVVSLKFLLSSSRAAFTFHTFPESSFTTPVMRRFSPIDMLNCYAFLNAKTDMLASICTWHNLKSKNKIPLDCANITIIFWNPIGYCVFQTCDAADFPDWCFILYSTEHNDWSIGIQLGQLGAIRCQLISWSPQCFPLYIE